MQGRVIVLPIACVIVREALDAFLSMGGSLLGSLQHPQ